MSHRRAHIVIPEDLAAEIDEVAGKGGRSQFLIESARREISRHRMIRAISHAAGAWKDEDHPELRRGADRHVATLRREAEPRLGARRSPKAGSAAPSRIVPDSDRRNATSARFSPAVRRTG